MRRKLILILILLCVPVHAFAFLQAAVEAAKAARDEYFQQFMMLKAVEQLKTLRENHESNKNYHEMMKKMNAGADIWPDVSNRVGFVNADLLKELKNQSEDKWIPSLKNPEDIKKAFQKMESYTADKIKFASQVFEKSQTVEAQGEVIAAQSKAMDQRSAQRMSLKTQALQLQLAAQTNANIAQLLEVNTRLYELLLEEKKARLHESNLIEMANEKMDQRWSTFIQETMNSILTSAAITDVSQIPATMDSLRALSVVVSFVIVGSLTPLEVIAQNVKALEGRQNYTGFFIRLALVFLGITLYNDIFMFLVKGPQHIEDALLKVDDWANLLAQIKQYSTREHPTFWSRLEVILPWTTSFFAVFLVELMNWIRYCLLAVLYFLGPIIFAFKVFEPTGFLVGSWFKNVLQLSCWTITLKAIVMVMLKLGVAHHLAVANGAQVDIHTLTGIQLTFLVMVFLSPFFTAQLISGQALTSVSMAMTSVTARTMASVKVMENAVPAIPAAAQKSWGAMLSAGRTITNLANKLVPSQTRTEIWNKMGAAFKRLRPAPPVMLKRPMPYHGRKK